MKIRKVQFEELEDNYVYFYNEYKPHDKASDTTKASGVPKVQFWKEGSNSLRSAVVSSIIPKYLSYWVTSCFRKMFPRQMKNYCLKNENRNLYDNWRKILGAQRQEVGKKNADVNKQNKKRGQVISQNMVQDLIRHGDQLYPQDMDTPYYKTLLGKNSEVGPVKAVGRKVVIIDPPTQGFARRLIPQIGIIIAIVGYHMGERNRFSMTKSDYGKRWDCKAIVSKLGSTIYIHLIKLLLLRTRMDTLDGKINFACLDKAHYQVEEQRRAQALQPQIDFKTGVGRPIGIRGTNNFIAGTKIDEPTRIWLEKETQGDQKVPYPKRNHMYLKPMCYNPERNSKYSLMFVGGFTNTVLHGYYRYTGKTVSGRPLYIKYWDPDQVNPAHQHNKRALPMASYEQAFGTMLPNNPKKYQTDHVGTKWLPRNTLAIWFDGQIGALADWVIGKVENIKDVITIGVLDLDNPDVIKPDVRKLMRNGLAHSNSDTPCPHTSMYKTTAPHSWTELKDGKSRKCVNAYISHKVTKFENEIWQFSDWVGINPTAHVEIESSSSLLSQF